MIKEKLVFRTRIEAPATEVFNWHTQEGAFERLTPPWEKVEVVERKGGIENGAITKLSVHMGPFKKLWVARHLNYIEGRQFADQQEQGPFAYWLHTHQMLPTDNIENATSSYLQDSIDYQLPLGWLGKIVAGSMVRNKINKMFAYRHFVTAQDIVAHQNYRNTFAKSGAKIAITGASGLIGSGLTAFLKSGGHQVYRLVRNQADSSKKEIFWQPSSKILNPKDLEGMDVVIHLAGENIAASRWTDMQKARIRDSRIETTKFLADTLAKLDNPPRVLISASAIGYYGDRGTEILREESPKGTGFLSEVSQQWEAATQVATERGIRVVHLRNGIVLSPQGGALAKMLLPFKLGIGGQFGNGDQYMSWIAIDDVIGAIYHIMANEEITGAVNLVSPNPVTNQEFTKILGKVLFRPTIFPLPAFIAKLALGEMANDLLFSSARVHPGKLLANNYNFRHPDLEATLCHLLGK